MTKEERIDLYWQMYFLYYAATTDSNLIEELHMENGFCYFLNFHKIFVYLNFYEKLPELYAQKPINSNQTWFKRGDCISRLKCIENALKLCYGTGTDLV